MNATKTPIEDLRLQALAHYDEAASAVNHYSSFVRDAILSYNPQPEAMKEDNNKEAEDGLLELKTVNAQLRHLAIQNQKEIERLNNELLDALDLKQGNGPTALSMLKSELDRVKEQNGKLSDALRGAFDAGKEYQKSGWRSNNFDQFKKTIEIR